ncbi:SMP-30/gluconolactonase/LRE family protein [Gordonia sp. KTR9]|uniref:SMP-30/gluconolactonase/LRE family protein n=1 Tax=Gordonia sp. KTR9 TaxID=337191 RepID=UPI00027DE777|nr:SMP-30/gluconolactonase/LRE family protein [Gordonia sp. KTR9]AFR50968.1 Gluconolactonase [Gordonia sp. KTR9]
MEFREIVSGLGFLEGPTVLPDGRLVVTDVENGILVLVDTETGTTDTLAETRGGPNGAALGPGGDLYVVNNGGIAFASHNGLKGGDPNGSPVSTAPSGVQRVSLDGHVTQLYTECDGRPLLRPNDIVFDAHGGFYFTDTGRADGRSADLGGLYYAKADGSAIVELVHNTRPHVPLTQPNGVGLSPDGTVVYVSETGHGRLAAWDVVAPGELSVAKPRVSHGPSGAMFDSLAVDVEGNICVATLELGGITVLSPEGAILEFVEVPVYDSHVTNICFGGADLDVAYITSGGRGAIWELTGFRTGLRLNH